MKRKKEYKYYVVYLHCNTIGSCQIILERPIANMVDINRVSSYIAKNFCNNADMVIILNWKELKK